MSEAGKDETPLEAAKKRVYDAVYDSTAFLEGMRADIGGGAEGLRTYLASVASAEIEGRWIGETEDEG